jgi:hypothetical protein
LARGFVDAHNARMRILAVDAALAALLFAFAPAQQNRVSPHESVHGRIGDAALTITYGRPSMRGRTIFGALVPYDRVWCPGADEATTLESDHPLLLGDLRVPPGPHTIWMLPTSGAWTLVVSKEPSGFHTRYNPRADLGRVPLTKEPLPAPVERLTFVIDDAGGRAGTIAMTWETTKVSVPVRFP